MDQPAHKAHTIGGMGIGAEDEELVDAAQPAVRITAHKVDVHPFQIRRGIGAAGQFDGVEVLDVTAQDRLDPVGKGIGGLVPFRLGDLSRRITLYDARRFRELQRQSRRARRAAAMAAISVRSSPM